jgi:peptide/nickel transport system permease protein
MVRYIIRRLLYLILVMFVITLVTYLIFYVLPSGDPAIRFAGKSPTPEVVKEVRRQFGLDKPVYQQYASFMWRLFKGDEYGWPGFGFSFDTRSPVKEALFSRIGVTLQLGAGAAVLWVLLGVPLGILSALKRRTFIDRATMGFALFGVSAPVFAVGLAALYIFWQKLGIQALGTGYVAPTEDLGAFFGHMILPWSVLALQYAAFYARMVRSNLLETLGEDYIRTARAKGLSERKVIGKHGLRASLTPVVTIFGMDFSLLIGGAVLTESVFNLPGLGQLIVSSVNRQDIPVVLATTIVAAFFVSFMSLVVDILYGYLDPRVRFS